ncbi:MAG: methyltransferase [Patescibacteria group bacterium]
MKIQEYLKLIDSRAPGRVSEDIKISGLKLTTYPDVWNPKKGKSTKMFIGLLKKYDIKKTEKVLDLGTGCGVLALLIWKKKVKNILAADISSGSILNAELNFKLFAAQIKTKQSDLFSNIKGKFDLILFNAPATHPKRVNSKVGRWSLWGDNEALLKSFVGNLSSHLNRRGRALVMCSRFTDFDPLPEPFLQKAGLSYKYLKKKKGEFSTTTIIELSFI